VELKNIWQFFFPKFEKVLNQIIIFKTMYIIFKKNFQFFFPSLILIEYHENFENKNKNVRDFYTV